MDDTAVIGPGIADIVLQGDRIRRVVFSPDGDAAQRCVDLSMCPNLETVVGLPREVVELDVSRTKFREFVYADSCAVAVIAEETSLDALEAIATLEEVSVVNVSGSDLRGSERDLADLLRSVTGPGENSSVMLAGCHLGGPIYFPPINLAELDLSDNPLTSVSSDGHVQFAAVRGCASLGESFRVPDNWESLDLRGSSPTRLTGGESLTDISVDWSMAYLSPTVLDGLTEISVHASESRNAFVIPRAPDLVHFTAPASVAVPGYAPALRSLTVCGGSADAFPEYPSTVERLTAVDVDFPRCAAVTVRSCVTDLDVTDCGVHPFAYSEPVALRMFTYDAEDYSGEPEAQSADALTRIVEANRGRC